jgi:xanthine dehydrogenase small subunit
VIIGAGTRLSEIEEHLGHQHQGVLPLFEQLLPLFSSRLIRNRATLGGNLATASPIGDSLPVLLCLGAELTIASAGSERRVRLCDFFLDYRRTALELGEVIVSVHLARPAPKLQRFYKVSKRVLDDISTVAAAFALELDGSGRVERLAIAYGGIAATPVRAEAAERLALGKRWTKDTIALLLTELQNLGTPMTDHRGSAAYRRAMIGKLLEKFFAETCRGEALR